MAFYHRRRKIGTALMNAHLIGKDDDIPYRDARIEDLTPGEIAELSDAVFRTRSR